MEYLIVLHYKTVIPIQKLSKRMRYLVLAILVAPLLVLMTAFAPNSLMVKFEAASWEQSKAKAQSEGKLYFVDFDASYCATCRTMDESTYMDQRLASYIGEHVVAQRVDVQDFDGVMWSQQYEVDALPTLLVFDEQGNLVRRLVGYQNADDLLKVFSEVRQPVLAAQPSNQPTTPVVRQPVAADEPMARPVNPPNVAVAAPVAPDQTNKREEGLGLYEIAVRRQSSKGHAVQVGVYSSYETVLEQASTLKKRYNQKTIVHIARLKGDVVYKLLLGEFDSKRAAAAFRHNLRRDNIDGLLKDLSLMS